MQQLPFRQGSRQRKRQSSATQQVPTPGLGQAVNFILEKVGMLNYLVINVKGTVNLTGVGTFAAGGPWSLVDRIRVDLNLSNMNLVDADGPMCYAMARQMFRSWGPDGAGIWIPNPTSYSAPVASGDNTWSLPFFIPISANPGDSNDTGMINMQAPEVQLTVQVRLTPNGANVVDTFNTLTNATIELHQCYFSSLDPRAVILPLGQVVRMVQFTQPVVATGENTITIERQGKLMNTLTRFIANGAPSDGIDRLQIIANINDTMYDETNFFNSFEYERDYSQPRQVGTFYKDFWHAKENPGSGDGRDLINLEVLTTFQQKLFVSQGTTLGSGNNFYHLGRRVLVNFVSPATSGINPLSQ
jgi:hypothetical protein